MLVFFSFFGSSNWWTRVFYFAMRAGEFPLHLKLVSPLWVCPYQRHCKQLSHNPVQTRSLWVKGKVWSQKRALDKSLGFFRFCVKSWGSTEEGKDPQLSLGGCKHSVSLMADKFMSLFCCHVKLFVSFEFALHRWCLFKQSGFLRKNRNGFPAKKGI